MIEKNDVVMDSVSIETYIEEKTFKWRIRITKIRRIYKMKKTLIFGSLLAVFLLVMLPAISAAEMKVAQSAKTSPYLVDIQSAYSEALKAQANGPSPQTIILLTLLIWFLKFLRSAAVIVVGIILLIILKLRSGHNNTALTC